MALSCGPNRNDVINAQGHVLVLGGPGSGKTTLALQKAKRRVDEGLLPFQGVLFLSFSRAAVARVLQASSDVHLTPDTGDLSVHTFHSFFWELLRTHGYLLGGPRWLEVMLPHEEKLRSGRPKPGTPEEKAWTEERRRIFIKEGKVCFDLFAPLVAELLAKSALVRNLVAEKYPLVIVDEAQDTGEDAWSCVEELAPRTQVVCLADLDQQIFDYLPGVGPERIARIRDVLTPLEVDLGNQNNRSPGTDIVKFANDVLSGTVRHSAYRGVSRVKYDPRRSTLDLLLRHSLGAVRTGVEKARGKPPENIAILATTAADVGRISDALSSGPHPVLHRVQVDEAEVLLASKLVAFLLEPKVEERHDAEVAEALELIAAVQQVKATRSALTAAEKTRRWAGQVLGGNYPKAGLVVAVNALIAKARTVVLHGVPMTDWLAMRRLVQSSENPVLVACAKQLNYLVTFRRGERIAASFSALWANVGSYEGARAALQSAMVDETLSAGSDDLSGLHVMTIHRSKGKQFDGVVIYRADRNYGERQSTLVWRGDPYPYNRSRKIARVAITRARTHVIVLEPASSSCPVIGPHGSSSIPKQMSQTEPALAHRVGVIKASSH